MPFEEKAKQKKASRVRQGEKIPINIYSHWDGSQSGFDMTANDIMDSLSEDLMKYGDIQTALRRIMQKGLQSRSKEWVKGLQEMRKDIAERRRQLLEENNPDNIYKGIMDELSEIVNTEKEMLDNMEKAEITDKQEVSSRKEQLDNLPNELAQKMDALSNYDFMSEQAEAMFNELSEKLKSQLIDNYLNQMSQAMENLDTDRLKDMLDALNQMLEEQADGIEPDFDSFKEEYGDMFGDNPPESLDQLMESMARSMAAMGAMLNSMSQSQRNQLQQLANQLMEDMDLSWQMSRLSDNLLDMLQNMDWDASYDFEGDQQQMDLPMGQDIMNQLSDLESLEQQLAESTTPADIEEIDEEKVKKLVGEEGAKNLEQLKEITKQLEEAGFIFEKDGQLVLSPKAINYLGKKVLSEIMRRLEKDRMGAHDIDLVGTGHEREFETKQYEWGDPFNLNIERTIRNAITRRASTDGGTPVKILPEDFEVERTQQKVETSTVLMLDLSLSMEMRGNFLSAKKVAVALYSLISSKYPRDFLGIVGFSWAAKEISPADLIEAGVDWLDHGTNMEHGLKIARSMLANRTGNRQIIMITDGEPTAHIDQNGVPQFYYPPTRETMEKTVAEVLRATREQIILNTYMLDAYPGLKRFIDHITKMNGGRAFYTTPENLGEYVISDFVGKRR